MTTHACVRVERKERRIPLQPLIAIGVMMGAAPALASGLGGGEDLSVPWGRIVLSFLACAALAWGAILLLRRYQAGSGMLPTRLALPRAPERAIAIVETRRVSQHGDACLLRCRGKAYLLLVTPHQVTVLDSFAEDAP